jgi:hypothetical protein
MIGTLGQAGGTCRFMGNGPANLAEVPQTEVLTKISRSTSRQPGPGSTAGGRNPALKRFWDRFLNSNMHKKIHFSKKSGIFFYETARIVFLAEIGRRGIIFSFAPCFAKNR